MLNTKIQVLLEPWGRCTSVSWGAVRESRHSYHHDLRRLHIKIKFLLLVFAENLQKTASTLLNQVSGALDQNSGNLMCSPEPNSLKSFSLSSVRVLSFSFTSGNICSGQLSSSDTSGEDRMRSLVRNTLPLPISIIRGVESWMLLGHHWNDPEYLSQFKVLRAKLR